MCLAFGLVSRVRALLALLGGVAFLHRFLHQADHGWHGGWVAVLPISHGAYERDDVEADVEEQSFSFAHSSTVVEFCLLRACTLRSLLPCTRFYAGSQDRAHSHLLPECLNSVPRSWGIESSTLPQAEPALQSSA